MKVMEEVIHCNACGKKINGVPNTVTLRRAKIEGKPDFEVTKDLCNLCYVHIEVAIHDKVPLKDDDPHAYPEWTLSYRDFSNKKIS